MTLAGIYRPVTTEEAIGLFKRIRTQLLPGPQCPCGLASRLEVDERGLFAYLAELLAREWIGALPEWEIGDPPKRHPSIVLSADHQCELHRLAEKLDSVRHRHEDLARIDDPSSRLQERSRSWYSLFRFQEELDPNRRPIVFLYLTALGKKDIERL